MVKLKDKKVMSEDEMKNEKTATIKISLKSDSGYSSTIEAKISPNQWGDINKVIEGTLKTEYNLNKKKL